MINMYEVSETNKMIEHENLDVRTITLGISLLDCVDSNLEELNRKIYDKITTLAKDLVSTGQDIEKEFGIPIVNKRISIYADRPGRRCGMQMSGRFCGGGKDAGSRGERSRRELYRRLFGTCLQSDDKE